MLKLAQVDYRRRPRLQDINRMFPSAVGAAAYHALTVALSESRYHKHVVCCGHLALRVELRCFLKHYLQKMLLQVGYATDRILDDCFAADLGL